MKRLLTFLAFILISSASFAQSMATISLKGMGGHNDDESVTGMSGATSFYYKITPQYEVNGSKLVIYFEPSQALIREKSFINLFVGSKPVYSGKLTKDSIQRIAINLTRADVSSDNFLKVQVKTLLAISNDQCKDLDNPAMWVKIKNYSYLSLVKSNKNFFNNVNISNCFDSKTAIVYPANPSLHDLKAVAWAYARLKKTATREISVYEASKLPDTVRNFIMVGKLNSLTADKRPLVKVTPQNNQGLFYLHKSVVSVMDTITTMVDMKGRAMPVKSVAQENVPVEILFVSGGDDAGYEKTITALGNMNILNSTFGDYLLVNKAQNTFFKTIDENRSKLSLKQIGGVSDFLSGIGSLKSAFNFKNSDFSFTPKEVEIRIIANYSSLNPGDRGFFNIYLNGLLLSSEKLDASGKLNTSVTINRYQHHKYNTLEAEFRFYPSSGNCSNSFTNFFSEIDVDKSYLESKNPFITSDLSFYQYPEAFNSGTTRIVVSKKYAKYAAGAMGEIIYELNNNINANNFPEFMYSDAVESSELKKNNIIALLTKEDPLLNEFPDAPIKFNQNFRLYNTDNNTVVYSLSDTTSNGLAQIFYGRSNNATLVLTATGVHLAEAFLAASKSITEQLSTLSSNVCISDVNNNKYLFNINKSSENLEYIDTKSALTRFWDSYNLYILLGILVLILLSFLYIRSKVQKSQELFND
ncbi:cellulose biosynthesis cyclic di-GMP-binding regulatory protein BcsB [Mucilaginibacter glaciei]|uniref:Cellulose biosynthesis cyclic di-GMP-binding regulatory protein BcsB n=1 Tax=Mucilaginibacter glaciei TaxID=2772109 RepID=A0A926S367_9SPHI|nr:cellulose biosynthesis cyclic di-GMP-binding regulatory protein BcsB [Mucilaginibacter glaciei]MBD1393909.1 cellulose biosynthesis cyclic di-GMP-binding regulatory protein BcsB [Mucilaginibacter glaciei]